MAKNEKREGSEMSYMSKFGKTFEKRRRVPKWIKFLAFIIVLWLALIAFTLAYIGEERYNRRK